MLYDEFLTNTGCKDTAFNYQIYKRLELLYMADETITKAEIYEYGKKLVDNSLTEAQVKWNEDRNAEIDTYKTRIAEGKEDLKRYQDNLEWAKGNLYLDKERYNDEIKFWKRCIKDEKDTIARLRNQIRLTKECLYV